MRRFFISQTAIRGSQAEALLAALRSHLAGMELEYFDESYIRQGERWRVRLYHELAFCDAAIVLLDNEALKPDSWWMRREVYSLLWRQYLGSVELRVALLDGIRSSDVRSAGYGDLTELQLVKVPTGADMSSIASKLIAGFGARKANNDDPMHKWANGIANILEKVDVPEALKDFAGALGLDDHDLLTVQELIDTERCQYLAHQLLGRTDAESIYLAVQRIRHIIGRDSTRYLAEWTIPAVVDGEAAGKLLRRQFSDQEKRRPVFVLNAEVGATAGVYVKRASCCDPRYRHIEVSAALGENLKDELKNECIKAIAGLLYLGTDTSSRRVQRQLADYREGKSKLVEAGYLTIDPADAPMDKVAEAIREIRDQFPWLAVIVITGPEIPRPEDTDKWGLRGLMRLEPQLLDDEETKLEQVQRAFTELTAGA
jgi:hypothetical protein